MQINCHTFLCPNEIIKADNVQEDVLKLALGSARVHDGEDYVTRDEG